MATSDYITYRKKWGRPQGLLFADAQGTVVSETFLPDGDEFINFIVLTDDNRQPIDMSMERIEQRERMINGRMRSYHVSDKKKISVNWDMVPSRAFAMDGSSAIQATAGGLFAPGVDNTNRFTTDGGAGGVEMLAWYKANPGSFWVYIAYDNHENLSSYGDQYAHLAKYNERLEMYFADFNFNVVKRGPLFDWWNVSLSLEEV